MACLRSKPSVRERALTLLRRKTEVLVRGFGLLEWQTVCKGTSTDITTPKDQVAHQRIWPVCEANSLSVNEH